MTTIAEIEKQIAERRKADARRIAEARRKADEKLGAQLRDLVAPGRARAEQVELAERWLAEQAGQLAKVTESRQEEPRDDWAEGGLAEHSEAV